VSRKLFVATAAALMLVAGCASLPADLGRGDVATLLQSRGQATNPADAEAARRLLDQLGERPLAASDAVQLALVNNPHLKAEYARLGFAAAEVYDAGRLSNPRLSVSVLFPDASGAHRGVLGLAQSFTNLLLLPARSRFAEGEFERAKQEVGTQVLNLAADVEAAHYRLAGGWQIVTLREAVLSAAQVSADLAQRFFDSGNINRLELAREQAAASQARLDLLQARAEVTVLRGELNRLMGLTATEDRWKIAGGLAEPVASEDAWPELLKAADANRLDLAAARKRVTLFADALGVTRRFRYLGEVEVGVETEREIDGSRLTGPTLALELPIFNQGKGRVARAEADLQLAEAELRALEVEISNSLWRAAAEVEAAKTRAEHYRQSLIPLREAIVARTQEQVNYMLVGQFELLLVKQQEYDAYQGYLEVVRDYWIARTELARAVGAQLPSSSRATGEILDAEELTRPKDTGMPMGDMKGMQHDMPGMKPSGDGMKEMDHSGHGGASQKKTPEKDAAPSMPPPRKGEGPSDMPTGMEGHIPEPAGKPDPAPKKTDPADPQQHGDHP
jgi:cobalt-zinc-cadmium efflux system outer membrane protein